MIGSHTARKTAASYISSVSSIHSESAFCLRMGWKLEGAKGRYIQLRADSHGDCIIGRIIAGLPVQAAEFATLPPHFAVTDDQVQAGIKKCFPNAPLNLVPILELCLASLLYHREYLRSTLAAVHQLFRSPLFADPSFDNLVGSVQCVLPSSTSRFQASGVPTLTTVLIQLKEQRDEISSILPRLRAMPEEIVEKLDRVLEDKAIGYGQVTYQGLEDRLREVLSSMFPSHVQEPVREAPRREPNRVELHQWGGGFHLVPEGFTVPQVGLRLAWQAYVCPNVELQCPPLRSVSSLDMSTINKRKRLSEFQVLMREIKRRVEEVPERWIPYPTYEEADEMFYAVQSELGVSEVTPKGRKRRVSELNWRTASRDILKKSRACESVESEEKSDHSDAQ